MAVAPIIQDSGRLSSGELGRGVEKRAVEENDLSKRISELEQRLAEARARLPRHSLRSAQMIEIEELEEELERLRAEQDEGS